MRGKWGFTEQVGVKAARKLKARREAGHAAWFGFGLFGVVGWSVVVPTVGGVFIGAWLDRHHPNNHSWTLTFMIAGLVLGCANAWHWITAQSVETDAKSDTPDA